jgi:hypothetical protein
VPSFLRIVTASLLAGAIALPMAACSPGGSSGPGTSSATPVPGTPDQIVQQAVSDLKAATSLRINGSVVSQGTNITIDFTDVAAHGCQGTLALAASPSSSGAAASGAAVSGAAVSGLADLIEVNSTVYMKLDKSFFKNLGLPTAVFAEVTGKYIKVTSTSELANFAQLCDPSTLASSFDQELTGFVKDGTSTIGGQATEAFKQPAHAGSGIVYVSESATPEILRLQGPGGEGQVTFSNYNAPATITAPPASDVIDGSKFGL